MNPSSIRLGEKLRVVREQAGFTQSAIANYLKVDQSLISKIEKGERTLTSDLLDRLAALFGIHLSSLSDSEPLEKPLSLALRAKDVTNEDLEIIAAINKIALNCSFMTELIEGDRLDR